MLELNDISVIDKTKEGNYLLMFYSDRCPRCQPISDILCELEQTEKGFFQFARINYDANPQAQEHYHIPGVPVILVIKDGTVLEGWGGLTDAGAYSKIVRTMFKAGRDFD